MNDIDQQLSILDPEVRMMLAEDLPRQRSEFLAAVENGDVKLAIEIVHAVNGSASFCRLESLRCHAAAVENALRNNDMDAAVLDAFENSVTATLHALEKHASLEETGHRS